MSSPLIERLRRFMGQGSSLRGNKADKRSADRSIATGLSARKLWRKIHLYIALTVGIMFAFSGLTGSLLVFYQDIDEYFNPALLTVDPANDYVPLTDITAAAQAAVPDEARLTRLYFPRHAQAAMKLRFSVPIGEEDSVLEMMINPFTAEILGQREYGSYLMSFIYKLHYTLVLGDIGKKFMGVMGLMLLSSVLSGLYLWWPKLSNLFRALTFKRSVNQLRFIYDLHKTIGIYISVVLIVIALSGVYMIFPHYVKPLVGMVSPLTQVGPAEFSRTIGTVAQRPNINEISNIAHHLFPKAKLQRIYFPLSAGDPYRVIMRQHNEVRKTSGSTQLWINSSDGKVLSVQQPQTMGAGDAFINWMYPLHNGEAFGLLGRIIVFVTGISLVTLYITGLMIWWRKYKDSANRKVIA